MPVPKTLETVQCSRAWAAWLCTETCLSAADTCPHGRHGHVLRPQPLMPVPNTLDTSQHSGACKLLLAKPHADQPSSSLQQSVHCLHGMPLLSSAAHLFAAGTLLSDTPMHDMGDDTSFGSAAMQWPVAATGHRVWLIRSTSSCDLWILMTCALQLCSSQACLALLTTGVLSKPVIPCCVVAP